MHREEIGGDSMWSEGKIGGNGESTFNDQGSDRRNRESGEAVSMLTRANVAGTANSTKANEVEESS